MSSMTVTVPRFCRTTRSATEFERALRADDIDKLRACIDKESFQPNTRFKTGALPLHLAVDHPCPLDIVKALLDKGADPLLKDSAGLSALDHAFLVDNPEKSTTMLDSLGFGGEVVKSLKSQEIEQAKASLKKAYDFLEVTDKKARAVCRKAKETWEADCYGMTPLHYALAASSERVNISSFLARKEDLNKKTIAGLSPLHLALIKDQRAALDILLQHPELMRETTATGLTPLHIAFLQNDFESAKKIAQAAPDLMNTPDVNGLTPRDILFTSLFGEQELREQKSGLAQNSEKFLLALQIAVPLFAVGSAYFEQEGLLKVLPYLMTLLHMAENVQTGLPQVAFVGMALDYYFAPTAKMAIIGRCVRMGVAAYSSFERLRQSYSYSAYRPVSSLRDSIVHIATGSLSVGRTLYSWLHG